MKIQRAKSGPFPNFVYFEEGEIDSLMEDHYFGCWGGKLDLSSPGLNMKDFIDSYLSDRKIEFDPKASSSELGIGVLGKTIFNPDGSKIIQVEQTLFDNRENSKYRGRYNFTVAHESFHALHHAVLFDFSQKQLEWNEKEKPVITCMNRDVLHHENESESHSRKSPWYEVQANMGSSALLMPKTIFTEHFRKETKAYGLTGSDLLERKDVFTSVVGYLSSSFGASKQAVKFRISSLGLFQEGLQAEFQEMMGGDELR